LAKLSSALLAVLLAGSVLWGQCAYCPLIAPAHASNHDCCQPQRHSGSCQMPSPKQPAGKTCPNLALTPVSHQAVSAPQLAAPATITAPLPEIHFAPLADASIQADPSPPDRYLLNSVLLV
jgi:hypothetical protein